MTKDEFFDRCYQAQEYFSRRGWELAGIRISVQRDWIKPVWKLWIVGPPSLDESLVIAVDSWPIANYTGEEKARNALLKFRRWLADWNEMKNWKTKDEWQNENS